MVAVSLDGEAFDAFVTHTLQVFDVRHLEVDVVAVGIFLHAFGRDENRIALREMSTPLPPFLTKES